MLKKMKISELIKAGFNPKSRQDDRTELAKSIERVGLLCPILVNKQKELCDGHRRLACCIELGWTEVPVIIANGEQADLFREVNFSNRRLSGNEALHAWLSEPRAVSESIARGCEDCEKAVGRPLLKRMANENYSLGLWRTLKGVAKQADQETADVLSTLVRWAMKHHCIANVRKALHQGMSPGQIVAAAMKDRIIRVKHIVAE